MAREQGLALGIDLGGTSVKVGVVSRAGEILGRGTHPTESARGVDGVVANIVRAARAAAEAAGVSLADLDGAGLGAPGLCNVPEGVVVEAVNLGWHHDVPVARMLGEALGVPVRIDNDANCAALGEQWCGAAQGSSHLIMFTLGTGVGGGMVMGGQIYHGASGWAGELGHMPAVEEGGLPCNCGRHGCLETVASATGMANMAKAAIAAGTAPYMAERAAAQQGRVDARLVIEAAKAGDEPARTVLRKAGEYLGLAAAGLVSALNPQLIVVGGGASEAGDLTLGPMREAIRRMAMPGPASVVRVVQARLGNDAGLIGAASLLWR